MAPPAASAGSIVWSEQAAANLGSDAATAAQWDRLNAMRGDLPFLVADAVSTALGVLGRGNERLFIGRRDRNPAGPIVAMFMLVSVGRWRWQTFQPSQLPLGAWVADAGYDIADLAHSLMRRALRTALVLSVTRVDPDIAARPPDGDRAWAGDYITTAWLAVEGTLQAYWAERGKNLRQNMRKQRNRLAAEGVRLEMRTLTAAADMAGSLERYGQLENAGWKAEAGSAVHAANAQGDFYRRLLEGAASRGEARVYEYCFDERSVAINLCLLRAGVLVILKTTYDESIKTFSPAFLLHQDIVEALFEGGLASRIEYFGGLMEWHTRWTDRSRLLYHLTLYRWGWLRLMALAWRRHFAAPAA